MFAQIAAFAALLPAALAPAAPTATDVTVAWASDAHQAVLVTWHETGDQADHITLTDPDGTPATNPPFVVAAGQPDLLTLPIRELPLNLDLRFSVQPVDADGQPLGDPAASVAFDTDQLPLPILLSAVPRRDGTVLMTWKPGLAHDDTPGDPLDLPASPVRYYPLVSHFDFNNWDELTTDPIAGESFVVPVKRFPENVAVVAGPNEFGQHAFPGNQARISRTDLSVSIPHTATTGRPLTVTGVANRTIRACDPGPCGTVTWPDEGRALHLQARTGAGAAWHTVATTKSAAKTGKYRFRITSPGTRDYRVVADVVVVPPGDSESLTYAATAAVTTRSGSAGGGGGLPITGAPIAWIAAAGALLVLLGAGLAVAGRRRRMAR